MEASPAAAPGAVSVIRGTGGIRTLRWAGSGRGKRGGIRTIYFYHADPEGVYLLTAYAKADRDNLTAADTRALSRLVAAIRREEREGKMTEERTGVGHEIETALGEILAHVRGEVALPCRMMSAATTDRIVALRKRLKLSRRQFADRFGLDVRALQEWEQGRRVPDRAARVVLTLMDHDLDSIVRALVTMGVDAGEAHTATNFAG